ncbi:hypothetical protein CEUSTIGMA_g8520.t1 [Chlamydomonas eustigma]|uniref:Uncharacterized protein n=1 Tax=Chlamydomonas eustigma TaxID=1157962 RepID=A0A250XDE9_9CHLO|nr:hypothetical protein CEUSTIGMA_g8520.t1 [Chlamydomonas eustigma]|eukprot:GAX81086.1 hypothetical protein CEUSTIGMA_g8520.t1 [Chlamydomonas eustigma]
MRVLLALAHVWIFCFSYVYSDMHWANAMCGTVTSGSDNPYGKHESMCHACVDATMSVGDPTRCHQCLRPTHGHMPDDLVGACLSCVPTAETKKRGWACSQYCTHHGIIQNGAQALDCQGCLMSDHPVDKWSCHVCMEQVVFNMTARRDCFKCLQAGVHNMYHCAACSRVVDPVKRAECFVCMDKKETYGDGKTCAAQFGVVEWSANDKAPAVNDNS